MPYAQAQKVGLVLSGGGAKGVAHIGVIRAIEEAGIPIDYITGTSMGAIIGGMYAAGYSPREMERMVTSEDFLRWVKGEIDEEYYFYYKKPENDASWLSLQFQADSTLTSSLPSSLVSPVQMDFVFMEYLASASAASSYDFDSLFIPFRCVASDIANNAQMILRDGDLGKAIRASMTFPFYFKPIRIDGKLLLDGGMYNNFPSDVMYDDFFPDIIIGSKVSSNYPPPQEDDIISQVQTVFMLNSSYSVICDNGVLIEPDLERVSITDFSRTQQFIDSGYSEARRMVPLIREFVFDSISHDQLTARRLLYRSQLPPIRVDSIVIEGLNPAQSKYVRRSLSGREGRVLDINAL
ncbi:MAG: patatin-like phospholipase family protein, partial [Bacteroidales bacterium]|nr:patatin-like phospholipase family protein [Bacteroidales bacterium]